MYRFYPLKAVVALHEWADFCLPNLAVCLGNIIKCFLSADHKALSKMTNYLDIDQ